MRQSESLCRKTQEKRIRKRNKKKKKIYIIKFESKQQVHESIKAVRIQEKKRNRARKKAATNHNHSVLRQWKLLWYFQRCVPAKFPHS